MDRRDMIKKTLAAGAVAGIVPAYAVAQKPLYPQFTPLELERMANSMKGHFTYGTDTAPTDCESACTCQPPQPPLVLKHDIMIQSTSGCITSDNTPLPRTSLHLGDQNYPLLETFRFGDHFIIHRPFDGDGITVVRNGKKDAFWNNKVSVYESDEKGVMFEGRLWDYNKDCETVHEYRFILKD